jgi:hypothetical protein
LPAFLLSVLAVLLKNRNLFYYHKVRSNTIWNCQAGILILLQWQQSIVIKKRCSFTNLLAQTAPDAEQIAGLGGTLVKLKKAI